jgi:hypothetical protein
VAATVKRARRCRIRRIDRSLLRAALLRGVNKGRSLPCSFLLVLARSCSFCDRQKQKRQIDKGRVVGMVAGMVAGVRGLLPYRIIKRSNNINNDINNNIDINKQQ